SASPPRKVNPTRWPAASASRGSAGWWPAWGAALLGVVGVAASPSGAPSLQPQLEALRGRLGDMTTRLGHIADLADHLRVHVGDWMPAPRRAETPKIGRAHV